MTSMSDLHPPNTSWHTPAPWTLCSFTYTILCHNLCYDYGLLDAVKIWTVLLCISRLKLYTSPVLVAFLTLSCIISNCRFNYNPSSITLILLQLEPMHIVDGSVYIIHLIHAIGLPFVMPGIVPSCSLTHNGLTLWYLTVWSFFPLLSRTHQVLRLVSFKDVSDFK